MGKTKIYQAHELPRTVVDIVRAVCADYKRREKFIKLHDQGNEVTELISLDMCKFLNEIVDESLNPIEPTLRPMVLEDICEKRGYEHSPAASIISKNGYYKRKRKFLYDIAAAMSLI